jgi:glycosyltransferase involved in cell wall biosynthesis
MKEKQQRILVCSDWFSPAYKAGGPVRSCVNFAHAMSDQYQVYVLTSNTDIGGEVLSVEVNKWIDYDNNVKVQYLNKENRTSLKLLEITNDIRPSIFYLNSMFSFFYSIIPLYLLFRKKLDVKIIVAPRGLLHQGAIKYKSLKKKMYLNILNLSGIAQKVFFHATDQQEKLDIQNYLKVQEDKIDVIPNFPQSKLNPLSKLSKTKGQLKIIFISRVAPKKNILFFLKQLKHVNADIQFSVYGGVEEGYWDECLKVIKELPENIEVSYKGSIEHLQVEQALIENHFFILSTFGENFGHAIFESFASGRPVLISDQTPWRNLEQQKIGWDISLDNKEEWINAIESAVNMEQAEFDKWCKNTWDYAYSFIYKSGLKEKYLNLFS